MLRTENDSTRLKDDSDDEETAGTQAAFSLDNESRAKRKTKATSFAEPEFKVSAAPELVFDKFSTYQFSSDDDEDDFNEERKSNITFTQSQYTLLYAKVTGYDTTVKIDNEIVLSNREQQIRYTDFTDFIQQLFKRGYDKNWNPLEFPPFQPHKLRIYQGLQIIGEGCEDAVKVATVFFAYEHALPVAKAIRALLNMGINFSNTHIRQFFYLNLLEAKEDSEKIISAVCSFNTNEFEISLTSNGIHSYLNFALRLKQKGIKLTNTFCMFLVRIDSSALDKYYIEESLIALHTSGILFDYLYMSIALHGQCEHIKKITDLLIFLQSNSLLTPEITQLIVINGSSASEILEEIQTLNTLSIETITEILKNKKALSAVALTMLSPMLEDAKITLTTPQRQFAVHLLNHSSPNEVVELFRAINQTGPFADYIILVLDLYNLYAHAEDILKFIHLQQRSLTKEYIDFVMIHGASIAEVNQTTEFLIHGYKMHSACELPLLLLQNRSVCKTVKDDFKKLNKVHLLPQEWLTEVPENKLSRLTAPFALSLLKSRKMHVIYPRLLACRNEIELLDDLVMECILSRDAEEIPDVFDRYLSLIRDRMISETDIEDVALAILCRTELQVFATFSVMKHIQQEKCLPLPSVLIDCVFSFFRSAPSDRTLIGTPTLPGCRTEPSDDSVSSQSRNSFS